LGSCNGNRTAEVEYQFSEDRVLYRITDQGKGFDHQSVVAKLLHEESTMNLGNGRGIRIAMQVFDRVVYNDKGNQVTLLKYLAPPAGCVEMPPSAEGDVSAKPVLAGEP
jgi:anti-sigma regulatory factor (Ser/Thr protein kinase)